MSDSDFSQRAMPAAPVLVETAAVSLVPRNGGAREAWGVSCGDAGADCAHVWPALRILGGPNLVSAAAGTGAGASLESPTKPRRTFDFSRHRALSWGPSLANRPATAPHRRVPPYPWPRPGQWHEGSLAFQWRAATVSTHIASRHLNVVAIHGYSLGLMRAEWPAHPHHHAAAAICQWCTPAVPQACSHSEVLRRQ